MSHITKNGNVHSAVCGAIAGVVTAVPKYEVRNEDLPGRLREEAEEAAKMTGVVARRRSIECSHVSQLAKVAAREVMERLGWSPLSIDLIIYVTQTPTQAVPAEVHDFKHILGLRDCAVALQINWSCAGYVYGLWTAMTLLQDLGQRALLIVGDQSSAIMDPEDRATGPLFGDAVSATAIDVAGPLQHFVMGSDGAGNAGLSQDPNDFLHMDGAAVFGMTLQRVPKLVEDVLALPGWAPEAVLFHQANRFMLDHLQRKCEHLWATRCAANCRTVTNIERFGNCSSASIPLLMCTELTRAAFDRKMLPVAMFGFGAGWAWAGARIDCTQTQVADLVEV